jgi:hypothetical protein
MNPGPELAALGGILGLELAVLRRGQRRAVAGACGRLPVRMMAYVLAAPGIALHEGAHYLACLALGVPVGGQLRGPEGERVRTRWFWPRRTPDGNLSLGGVVHARTDPLRQALIASAPLILVPPTLALLTAALLGASALAGLPDALGRVPIWHAALWCYLALSCGQAAFPSPGDRVGVIGAVGLVVLGVGLVALLIVAGGLATVLDALGAVVGVLAVPAAAAAVLLALSGGVRRRRRFP